MTAQQLKNAILQELFLPKENWEEKELKDIVSKQCPISYGIVQQGNHVDGGVPVVRPVDLHCKYVGRNYLKCTSPDISESYSRTILRGDEILLCVRGTTGIMALAKVDLEGCNVNRGIVPLFFDDDIDKLFVYYQLQTPKVQEVIASNTMGSALRQINIKDLRKIVLSYPPLAEQKRIVEKIEELMPKVEEYGKAQEKLNKLNEELPERLKKSILQEAIEGRLVPQDPNDEPASVLLAKIREEKKQLVKEGKLKKKDLEEYPISEDEIPFEIPDSWEWVRFSQLYWQLTDGTHSTPKYKVNGIPFLSVKDMSTGKLDFSNTKFISAEEHSILSQRCHPQKGDLLISKVGTTGIPLIIDTDREFSIFVSLALIKFFPQLIDCNYLLHLINSPLVQLQVKDNTRGVGNKNWVLTAISNTIMVLPPLAEQHRIVEKIEQLFKEIDKLKK